MALKNCKECDKEVSDNAKVCPYCGVKNPVVNLFDVLRRILLLLVVIFIVYKIVAGNSQPNSYTEAHSNRNYVVQPQQVVKESVTKVNISNLIADYESNEIAANNKYKGHLIEVTGILTNIKKDLLDKSYVDLSPIKKDSFREIKAYFNNSMDNRLAELKKGQKMTVTCRVDGLMMDVLLKDCSIN
ncbi:OB-fold protein [Photobacterium leiognathi]|uniref:OB-fold protein n=1 Tax=Photobacterium leiognathi TaxID=553611 RepID=UPI002738968F|nr:hypothetical protein [Photobacterium leiognathi]